ncbi:polysaccharide deacetylase family protein [Clostridium sp. Ade.TY]|uniref:polysaccharide deacetylase family protein n=1 Tax=Clostridium sp. Ade.TY TaxID=1391647 RepID=UPI00041230C7|nr:polysaccharide deacetylase family protein [Clostridium sp. Ade.TY]
MRRVYTCFPHGKVKALTLSYDDGSLADIRLVKILNENGIKGTFHLNSNLILDDVDVYDKVPFYEVKELYKGHEVACHTLNHPDMTRTNMTTNIQEVINDRINIEDVVDYPVRGMSYPYGTFNLEIKNIMKMCGIAYSRITGNSENFNMPKDFYEWKPTCHHNHKLLELCDEFLKRDRKNLLSLFYVWGHSYEFDRDNNWKLIEDFAKKIGHKKDIWYATNIEIVDYINASKRLQFFADCSKVFNPNGISIWLSIFTNLSKTQKIIEVKPLETVSLK